MWLWIIIGAVVIGGIFGFLSSDSDSKGGDAASGALAGGCMAVGCLGKLAFAALGILLVLWLFGAIFG